MKAYRDWTRYAAAGVALIALTAGVAIVADRQEDARVLLDLPFSGVTREPTTVLTIAGDNLRIAAAVLLAAATRPHIPRAARTGLDACLVLVGIGNVGLVGLAIGAYGHGALLALAPHLGVELAAFSVCAATYGASRQDQLRGCEIASSFALVMAMLGVAAVLETYSWIGVR